MSRTGGVRARRIVGKLTRAVGLGGDGRGKVVVRVGKGGDRLLPPRSLQHFPSDKPCPGQTRWEVPAWLRDGGWPWAKTLAHQYEHPLSFPFSLSPQAGLLLHSLVLNARPRVVIETGTCIGISAMWIAGALQAAGEGGRLHCFDAFEPLKDLSREAHPGDDDRIAFLKSTFREAGLGEIIQLHQGDSSRQIPKAAATLRGGTVGAGNGAESGGVQLAFIDGDHTPEGAWRDFEAVEPLLDTGGLVVFHDTFPHLCGWTGPRQVMNRVSTQAMGTYQVLDLYLSPVNYGLGVMRRVG